MELSFLEKIVNLFTIGNGNPFKSLQILIRFCWLIILIIVTISFFVNNYPDVQIFNDKGFSISQGNKSYYIGRMSTSQLWDTLKINFEKGDTVTITATGHYNSSAYHITEYARTDTNMVFPWVSTKGIPHNKLKRDADTIRSKKCILPQKNYGALLVQEVGITDSIYNFSDVDTIKFTCRTQSSQLAFAVNEPPLTVNDSAIYVIYSKTSNYCNTALCKKKLEDTWKNIKKDPELLRRLWFDDNLGDFNLFVIVSKKSKPFFEQFKNLYDLKRLIPFLILFIFDFILYYFLKDKKRELEKPQNTEGGNTTKL